MYIISVSFFYIYMFEWEAWWYTMGLDYLLCRHSVRHTQIWQELDGSLTGYSIKLTLFEFVWGGGRVVFVEIANSCSLSSIQAFLWSLEHHPEDPPEMFAVSQATLHWRTWAGTCFRFRCALEVWGVGKGWREIFLYTCHEVCTL